MEGWHWGGPGLGCDPVALRVSFPPPLVRVFLDHFHGGILSCYAKLNYGVATGQT